MYKILLTTLSLLFLSFGQSQVLINEYSAANFSDIDFQTGPGTAYEDWIELYNPTGVSIDLTGFFLSDKLNNPQKWQFPAGVSIPANGYLTLIASSEDALVNGYQNTNFKLTQTKGSEYVLLSNSSGVIIDSIKLNYANQKDHSRGRITDGAATWAVFDNTTQGASNTGAKTKYAEMVDFSIAAGFHTGPQTLTLSTTEPGATIRYTTNGSEPNASSTLYTTPINIVNTTVIRARAFSSNPNILSSHVETNTYFIDEVHTVKVVSVCGDLLFDLFDGTQNEPEGSLELFETDGTFLTEATGEFNKHGNDSWAYDQRGVDFIAKDQLGVNFALENEIFDTKNRDEYQKVILKCGASDNYPFETGGAHIRDAYINEMSQLGDLRLDERSNEFAVLYLNGDYWGVYDIREKTDDSDFTDYYYDQDVPNIQYLKTWGATWEEYGAPNAQNDWDNLVNFIDNNNMTVPANYDYVDSLYNTGSLIDYFILNGFVVCSDWLNWNTGWWRGLNPAGDKQKWRYTLWDMDATFGHYVNYTGIPNQGANADPCDPESLGDPGGQGHVPIWNKLQTNEEFFADYINRYAELSSTVFTCDSMHDLLNTMVAEIQPEMPRHITKWGGTMTQWQANVQDIHNFIDTRCVNVPAGLVNCNPEISGPYELIINVDPPLSGEVQLTGLTPTTYPYVGTYFGGVNIDLDADEFPGWDFDYWTVENDTLFPDSLMQNVFLDISMDDSIVAHFKPEIVEDTITFIVLPAGSGEITINGIAQTTYPFTDSYTPSSLMTLAANANAGFSFSNWSMTTNTPNPNNTTSNISITLAGSDTIYAYFDPIPVDTITYIVSPAGAGTITENGTNQTVFPYTDIYTSGSSLALAANANAGYTFSNWTMSNNTATPNNTTNNINIILGSNDTVYAYFNPIPVDTITLIVNPAGSGTITENGTNQTVFPYTEIYSSGSNLTLNAIANGGFQFNNWSMSNNVATPNNNTAAISVNLINNDTIYANFDTIIPVNEDTIVYLVDPIGSGSIELNGTNLTPLPFTDINLNGALQNIEAISNTGYAFSYWEASNNSITNLTNASSDFTSADNDTIVAHFDVSLTDTLVVIMYPNVAGTLNVGGDVINTSPYTGVYPTGALLNIEATASTGNSFDRWELNTQSLPDYNPITSFLFVNQDTLMAIFNTPTFVNNLGEDFENFSVYPSVNDGQFLIDFEVAEATDVFLNLVNLEGKVVSSWDFANRVANQSYREQLQFEGSDGIYLLKISSNKTNATEKILKMSK